MRCVIAFADLDLVTWSLEVSELARCMVVVSDVCVLKVICDGPVRKDRVAYLDVQPVLECL
jgi:hypothetical protein